MMCFPIRAAELPRPIWFTLVILGFICWWPLGLAITIYLIWSGNMRCCGFGFGEWRDDRGDHRTENRRSEPSGNRAFAEYRVDTLRRLEEEEREFHEFLSRLRMAKDRAELEQFMAERRSGAQPGPMPPQSA
jgi:Protein of unknown function (DUF2852)